jgi:hypothetical protein
VSLDGLPPAHLQVLLDGLPVFERYGLLLAGGYAFRAHEIVHWPSQDLDFATSDNTPLPEIAAHVRDAFQRAVTACGLPKRPARGTHAWYCSFPAPVRNLRWISSRRHWSPGG